DETTADIYVLWPEPSAKGAALAAAEGLRRALPDLRIQCALDGGALKNQLKRADRSGARFAVIIEDTAAADSWRVKSLRQNAPLEPIPEAPLEPAAAMALLRAELAADRLAT
ncbi:MAG: histidine--tRNA ligase, partial [Halothiobacillus sp.]|nr:histidine--tRNA ligase [Halothiobacillus sp.]